MSTTYTLQQFPEKLVVARLAPGAEVPDWAESSSVFSVTATATETSIVCAGRSVPKKVPQAGPFTAFAVEGTLDLTATGILAGLLAPRAEGAVPVFCVSSTHTAGVRGPLARAAAAPDAWRRQGHTVAPAVPV